MIRSFFILFMSFFAYVYSDLTNVSEVPCPSSLMTIEAVDVSNKTTIFLNNRIAFSCKYKDLFDGPYGWQIGDRVHVIYVYPEGYYLQNASCQGCVPVKIKNNDDLDLKVPSIKQIIKNEKDRTTTLLLTDATKWFIGPWSSIWMVDWQVGDKIVPTTQDFIFGNADHLLLNLDQGKHPENVRAQLLSSPQTIKFEDLNKRETREWKMSVASIWHQEDSFIVELSNKTAWKFSFPKKEWQIGDEVQLSFDIETPNLINLKNCEKIAATIINQYSKEINLPTIQKISKDGKEITLSDDSLWFSKTSKFKKWKKGSRIIASPLNSVSFDTSSHVLMNIDLSPQKDHDDIENHTSATLVK